MILNQNNTETVKINQPALAASFLLSAENSSQWNAVVEESIAHCSQNNIKLSETECDVISKNIFSIITCSYIFNYVNCPDFNPLEINECLETREYILNKSRGRFTKKLADLQIIENSVKKK